MCIIIQRRYAHLEKEMLETFGDQEKVKIIVDRRHGERRTRSEPAAAERRCGDRRKQKVHILEVVIST